MIEVIDHGRVRQVTFNRPEALNAMNNALYWAAADALTAASNDPDVAVVVLTGNGRAFCAGQDMTEMSASAADSRGHGFPAFADGLAEFRKPVLAAVNGVGLGIGATMLPFCDLVFMADTARLKLPFPTLGVAPEAGSSYTFPAVVGGQIASYYLFTAEWMSAEVALASGLAYRVTPADDVLRETLAVATTIAAMPIPSLVATKELIVAARRDAVRAARDREDAAFAALLGGPANREAIAAFLEKRPADFTALPAT
jgi:enoyl-CoA hydratase/carnithine racemase